jgi:hypothetical protein
MCGLILYQSNKLASNPAAADAGRNEGSTPRSFILPATPAVALIQEEKVRLKENELTTKRCLLALHDLGFFIRDLDDIYDDNISVIVLRYQMKQKIEQSAKLDESTIVKLGCR